ncbi:LPP20 family lipoprotein [Allohahella sp. A8]|uniref:LPP20 family lipoprotein n=1 Tax=Allohahella sp. A8 TaxID=3141461 RepID=UPI0026A76D8B
MTSKTLVLPLLFPLPIRLSLLSLMLSATIAGCKTVPPVYPSANSLNSQSTLVTQPVQTDEVPQWVLAPPVDTAAAMYGVGERSTLDQAKKAALAEIAGKLGTVIQAETATSLSMKAGQTSESLQEDIQATVASTEFSDFEVMETAVQGGRYWVLVKVDKNTMANRLNAKSSQLEAELTADFSDFAKRTSLAKVRWMPDLQTKLEQAQQYQLTLKALSPGLDFSSLNASARQRQQMLDAAKQSLRIRLEHDRDTTVFANQLKGQLSESKLTLEQGSSRQGKSVIAISSDATYQEVFGDQMVKLLVDIQAIDENGAVIATSNHLVSGASRTSKQAALEQANHKLAQAFSEQGLLQSLGL